MKWIDTHAHLYLEQFDHDRDTVIQHAVSNGVSTILLPNIDQTTIAAMLKVCSDYPDHCFPMMGLHPGSIKEDYRQQLDTILQAIDRVKPIAIGEIGLDFYWDIKYKTEQIKAFTRQLDIAKELRLPVVIHTREAFDVILELVESAQNGELQGVFHCFTGTLDNVRRILDLGFYMGIGGVLTYKKSELPIVVKDIPLNSIVLETDAPYLPPVPFRGKRNESSFMIETAKKLAEIKQVSLEEVAETTTSNAIKLFNLS
ncbi:MAG: TatD family hydrolase [Bacteroidales bacterium]|jgi:TatD DNase family protein|nr:TatD family hydrolase [Bacteroidales bacterium]MDD3702199.1 TatD family hydrolase [Bacteroidales bacterium]MDY0368927.1 TatD family hydrolase [Bacteroidales bacterium]